MSWEVSGVTKATTAAGRPRRAPFLMGERLRVPRPHSPDFWSQSPDSSPTVTCGQNSNPTRSHFPVRFWVPFRGILLQPRGNRLNSRRFFQDDRLAG